MAALDVSPALRKVAALRALCLRLPHLPTALEREHLRRFEALTAAPDTATEADADALLAGWRRLWRAGDVDALWAMASRTPAHLVAHDRGLATLWTAARVRRWERIQQSIWDCDACAGRRAVVTEVRQQAELPDLATKLLVISLAPPFTEVRERTRAVSATRDPGDPLRRFLEAALDTAWEDLACAGLALLHAVKCAIRPRPGGFQNPPSAAVDDCAPRHLAEEISVLRPPVVLTLGDQAYRALVRAAAALGGGRVPALPLARQRAAAGSGGDSLPVTLPDFGFRLVTSTFPRGRRRQEVSRAVRRAARLAGITPAATAEDLLRPRGSHPRGLTAEWETRMSPPA